MSLPALSDLKSYLRVETTAEDTLLGSLLAAATTTVRQLLNRPIESTDNTYTLEDPRASATSASMLSIDPRVGLRVIRCPDSPVATDPAITLIDRDGNTVDPTTYRLDTSIGKITAAAGYVFARFPYTLTATVGLATRSDYATMVEPALFQGILDIAADLYFRRNPAATIERDSGVSTSYGRMDEGTPIRTLQLLQPYCKVVL